MGTDAGARSPKGVVAAWAVLAAVLLLTFGGAARSPDGILLGSPGIVGLAVVAAGLALAMARGGWRSGPVALGLLPLLALVLVGLPVPGARALTGPPLLALALGAAVLILGSRRGAGSPWLFLVVVLAVHLTAAWRVQSQVGPNGDEPHYLMVADSLLHDGDVAVEEDFEEGRYRAFHPRPLKPHYRVRGREGVIYSLHAVGLSVLILPAYALGGYAGASFFMALLSVLVAWETRGLLRDVLGGPPEHGAADGGEGSDTLRAADAVAWVVALSPPLVHYAGLVFTEVAAALLVVLVLRHARGLRAKPWWVALALGLALSFLPWLNVRYVPVAGLLLLYALWQRPRWRGAVSLLGAALVSAVALGLYHFVLYGFADPRRVYGRRRELAFDLVPDGVAGILFDQEFGLLVYAPVFALAAFGFFFLLKRARVAGLVALALCLVTLGVAASWPMWRGGWNPPARFLVPVVPALALAVAAALPRGFHAPAALLAGWSLFAGLGGALEPRLVHRDRDGTAPLFRELSGAEEWTRLLPGYVLTETARDKGPLTAIWGVTLLLAVLPRRRGREGPPGDSAGRLALATAGLLVAAGAASVVSHGRTGGRDAVRVIGRPALEVPGWRPTSDAAARWGPEVLAWGPVYEPHRHPGGAVLGDRLPLPPGRYSLRLRGERLTSSIPDLSVQDSPAHEPVPAVALWPEAEGLAGEIVVPPAQRETTLRLSGGGPLRLEAVELRRTGES
jgi:hypothetical protein